MILKKFIVGPLSNNTIFLGCEEKRVAAVIDPSFGALKILKFAEKENFKIEMILLTHGHFDHVMEVETLKNKTNAKIYMHEEDEKLENLKIFEKTPKIHPDVYIKEGQKINIGNLELLVIHTPGHTPGSVCFYMKKEKILFSGDTIFAGSIGRIDFPYSNKEDMYSSLEKIKTLPKDTKIFPGHGISTSIEKESWLEDYKSYF